MMKKGNISKARTYVIEGAFAVLICYFLLGGSDWSPALWAVFAIVAIWIVVMNVRHDAGLESASSYSRWKLSLSLIMVLSLFSVAVWKQTIWLFIVSIALGVIWISDLRCYRAIHGQQNIQD